MLNDACREAARWPTHTKVAVNISAVQLRDPMIVEQVREALNHWGLLPKRLELEITETALIDHGAQSHNILRELKTLGLTIALDDFGAGYSSLSQLTMFPFDKIKIDKSFTLRMTSRADCAAVIAGVLALAKSLSIETTAEGVETSQQYELLKHAGVCSMQGYFIKRPGPVGELDFSIILPLRRVLVQLDRCGAGKRSASPFCSAKPRGWVMLRHVPNGSSPPHVAVGRALFALKVFIVGR